MIHEEDNFFDCKSQDISVTVDHIPLFIRNKYYDPEKLVETTREILMEEYNKNCEFSSWSNEATEFALLIYKDLRKCIELYMS